MSQPQPIARSTLSIQVYTWLRQQILSGSIKQGEHLSELAVSESTGVSATPVREALRMLSGDGLVELTGRRGVKVIQPSLEKIRHCFEVRKALECLALRKACETLTPADLQELARITELLTADSPILSEPFFAADHAFHDFFISRADNGWIKQFLSTLADFSLTVRRPLFLHSSFDGTRHEHWAVANAVIEGRIDDAERALGAHIDRVCGDVLRLHEKMQQEAASAASEPGAGLADAKVRFQ